jgi:hypothetical protein
MLARVLPIPLTILCIGDVHAQSWGSTKRVGFSLTANSASVGLPGSPPSTLPIAPGGLLTPENPNLTGALYGIVLVPPPALLVPIVKGRLPGGPPNGAQPSWTLRDELDGLSFILMQTFQRLPVVATHPTTWCFSVDRSSLGVPGFPLNQQALASEAHGDIFSTVCPTIPLGPTSPVLGNTLEVDERGDVINGVQFPGLGLHRVDDDVDALAFNPAPTANHAVATFFSLDTASANNLGYSGAHVFWHVPGPINNGTNTFAAGTRVYAFPWQLGLKDDDNVDALIVIENVVTGYQSAGGVLPANAVPPYTLPSNNPPERNIFALLWPGNPPTPYAYQYGADQVFFSISRKSASIGTLDSNGIPIMPGDILRAPTNPSPSTTVPPTIIIAAEVLGLRAMRVPPFDSANMDDIDGLEVFW